MSVVESTESTLSEYAQAVLSVAEDALATTAAGTPSISYVSPASPTFDCCPMLAVHVAGLFEGLTSPGSPGEITARRGDFGNIILATYIVTAVRCAPVPASNGASPTPAAIEAAAVEVQQDGWALWNGLRHAHANGEIFDGCLGVHFDGGLPIPEQGGCVGWIFTIRASIPGIPNPGVS